jgi:hypothetical protein
VLVRVGEPIDLDALCAQGAGAGDPVIPARLTARIEAALRDVTLNFATADRAARAVSVARVLGALGEDSSSVAAPPAYTAEVEIAARIERAMQSLETSSPDLAHRADALTLRLAMLEQRLSATGVRFEDLQIPIGVRRGTWFVIRELLVALVAAPFAILGRLTHWLPIRLARFLALRSLVGDPSRDQPAMRTMVLGAGFLLVWYVILAIVAYRLLGAIPALAWVVVTMAAGQIELLLQERLERTRGRARSYLAFRRDPELRQAALSELDTLMREAADLEAALLAG